MSQLKNTEEELKGLSKKELLGVINILKKKFNISSEELQNTTSKKDLNEIEIPTSIFVKELGSLECIVKYLKEELNLTYHEIALCLKRNEKTVWTVYARARKKLK